MTVISLSRMVRVLTDRGILHAEGDALRVVPDVLADQYTEVTAVEEGYDTGFVAELWQAFGQDYRRRLVLSLGELDWRLGRIGGPNIMAVVWEDLRHRLSSPNCSHLCEELGHLDQLAATQPSVLVNVLDELRLRLDREEAAGLVAAEEPEEAELVWRYKLRPRNRDSVRALMPALYGRAAAHLPEVLEQVLDALWSLRLAEDRTAHAQQDRTKDIITQKLLNLAVLPHASFPKRVVAWATTRTETMTPTIRGTTPLVMLKPLLAKEELETVQPSLRKLEFRPHLISATAMRTVRDQIRQLLTTRGQSDDLRLAGAAVELLGHALTEPHGYFNNTVPKETILSWEDDDLATVRALDHVATTTRSAVIRRLIRSKVAWSAEYATSALVQHAAIVLAARMDALDDVEDQMAELIAGGTLTRITERYASVPTLAALSEARSADEEHTQHLSDQERQDDRTTRTRSKVTARREAADRRMKAVTLALINRLDANEILAILNSVARDIKAAEPSARLTLRGFWQEMSPHAPHFFATAVRAIATDQPGPLDDELGTLITQWLHHEPTGCMSWLETAGGSGRTETRLAIARAVSAHEWQGGQLPDLRAIWSRGIDDENPIVAQAFLASAGGYLRQDSEHAAPFLMQHDISQFAACSALDEASRYEGQEFGAALRPDQAAAMLPLITAAGFTEASPAGILTGIATTQPRLVLGHLLTCAQAGTALPDNIDGLSLAFEENAESLATWVISQLSKVDPILLGDVVTTATNGRLTERQAQAFRRTIASLDGDDLVTLCHTLNDLTTWVVRQPQLAEAIMVRARETGVDRKTREVLLRGARLAGWGSTNGVSDELNQALAQAEQALSSTSDIDLRQIYIAARDQFKTRIDALAREEADDTDEEW